jgi:hypothetical protein
MTRRRKIKATLRYEYDGNLEKMYHFMMQRIGYDTLTLKMTQTEYDEFSDDLDYTDNESFYGSHFRPTTDQTDNCNLQWVFAGRLEFKIKIITE